MVRQVLEQALEGHTRVCGPLSPSVQSRGAHGIGAARRRHGVPGHWARLGAPALAAGESWAWDDSLVRVPTPGRHGVGTSGRHRV